MKLRMRICSLLMYSALDALFLGEFNYLEPVVFAEIFLLASLKPPSSLFYLPISCSISTTSKTLASTSPYSALITHHSLSSSCISNVLSINYLYFSSVRVPWKKGVILISWAAVYLPGGNNKFSRLLDRPMNRCLSLSIYLNI